MAPKKVSIIVCACNRADLTRRCLQAIRENTAYPAYEVILVDNGSRDETPALGAALVAPFYYLRSENNRLFAGGNNYGFTRATGDYVLFLNNDTEPQPGWLEAMVKRLESSPYLGAVGAKLLFPDRTVQHAGVAVPHLTQFPFHMFYRYSPDHPCVNAADEPEAVTAACLLTRREVFADAGGFNESYRNGLEDIEFCLSLREGRWKIGYCPEAVVIHHESQTPGRNDFTNENRELFQARWGAKLTDDYINVIDRRLQKVPAAERIPILIPHAPGARWPDYHRAYFYWACEMPFTLYPLDFAEEDCAGLRDILRASGHPLCLVNGPGYYPASFFLSDWRKHLFANPAQDAVLPMFHQKAGPGAEPATSVEYLTPEKWRAVSNEQQLFQVLDHLSFPHRQKYRDQPSPGPRAEGLFFLGRTQKLLQFLERGKFSALDGLREYLSRAVASRQALLDQSRLVFHLEAPHA